MFARLRECAGMSPEWELGDIVAATMGTWGTGLFDDDLAADIRFEWDNALSAGATPAEASQALIRDIGATVAGEEDEPVFWFVLVSVQLDASALDARARDEAIASIPRDLERWRASATTDDIAERERVLEALRDRLSD